MKVQFKGIKWINNSPRFLLYDIFGDRMFYEKIRKRIKIKKSSTKMCNGYYDLNKKKYIECKNKIILLNDSVLQCDKCREITGFNNCLKCNGVSCKANNDIALKFCNQCHVVYIALFGDNKLKVGTAAEYRKYERLQDQGAIASMFIASTPDGKTARFIEHTVSKMGYALFVTSTYKINNLLVKKGKNDLKKFFLSEYENIYNRMPIPLKKYLIEPKINYFEKINSINLEMLKSKKQQINLFDEQIYDYKYDIDMNPIQISGEIINVVGEIIIVKNCEKICAYNMKKMEGYIINIDFND